MLQFTLRFYEPQLHAVRRRGHRLMKVPADGLKNPVASRRSGLFGAFKLLTYLLRHSRKVLVLYLLAATISGFSNVGLMAVINATLTGRADRSMLLWSLIGACL